MPKTKIVLRMDGLPDKRYSAELHPAMIAQQKKGRPRGAKDKLTRDVKQMIERALELADKKGGIEYLRKQSALNPVAFLSLVGKILPKQIDVGVSVLAIDLMGVMQQRRTALAQLKQEIIEHVIAREK